MCEKKIGPQARVLKNILNLDSEPVAVYLVQRDSPTRDFADFRAVERHRYCQAIMRARRGEKVLLEQDQVACPAARRAFGFAELPPALASGEGLVGFGIARTTDVGRRMFENMPVLPRGAVSAIAACPLEQAPRLPDVVIIEDRPERLMWLLLADLNLSEGRRRTSDTAVLQATCVDATIVPYTQDRLNYTMGCYGCREATDLEPNETVLGFPGRMLAPLVDMLEYLRERAIPRSQAKAPWQQLHNRLAGGKA